MIGYCLVVLIPLRKKYSDRKIIIRLRPGGKTNTMWGVFNHDELAKAEEGSVVRTHLGEEFLIFRAMLHEYVECRGEFKHVTQIIRPRDWGLIYVFADITPDSKIIEIGTGSGGILAFLAKSLRDGFIYSYEKEADRAKVAEKNLEKLSLKKNYVIKVRDVSKGVDEKNADIVLIDTPDPWNILDTAYNLLRPGGRVVIYVPTANQIARTLEKMYSLPFVDIHIYEGFIREIQPLPYAVRPELKAYVFSAYIIIARKALVRPKWYDEILKEAKQLNI